MKGRIKNNKKSFHLGVEKISFGKVYFSKIFQKSPNFHKIQPFFQFFWESAPKTSLKFLVGQFFKKKRAERLSD